MPLIDTTPFRTLPLWQGGVSNVGAPQGLNNDFTARGALQYVGNNHIIGIYSDEGVPKAMTAQAYTPAGTVLSILDTQFDFDVVECSTGHMSSGKLDTDRALFGYQRTVPSAQGRLVVIKLVANLLVIGSNVTFTTNGRHDVTTLTPTLGVDASNQFSGTSDLKLTRWNVADTVLTTDYNVTITNAIQASLKRFDDTHTVMMHRNLSPDRWEIRVYNTPAVGSFSQVGTTGLPAGIPNSGDASIIRLRDDGDGIVYVGYAYSFAAHKKVVAFKVANGTYNVTVGATFTPSGGSWPDSSGRPLARLTDSKVMIDENDQVTILDVDAGLTITQDSVTPIAGSSQRNELEPFGEEPDDVGNIMWRQSNVGRLLKG